LVGATIAVNGTLSGLAVLTPPPGVPPSRQPHGDSARMFTLVDSGGPGVPRTIVNFDPFTHAARPNQVLSPASYRLPFQSLEVASCPAGAMFRVNVA
jgi:hypothetical protein